MGDSNGAHDLTAVLAALYACEINCGISSFWDEGWTVWIGDDMNGYRAEVLIDRGEHHLIATWLAEAASALFPLAVFPWERRAPTLYRGEDARRTPPRATLGLAASSSASEVDRASSRDESQ